jgi:hypothetical protein
VFTTFTETDDTPLSSLYVPYKTKLSRIVAAIGGYVISNAGACVSTTSPSPTSHPAIESKEAKAAKKPKTEKRFLMKTPRKKQRHKKPVGKRKQTDRLKKLDKDIFLANPESSNKKFHIRLL